MCETIKALLSAVHSLGLQDCRMADLQTEWPTCRPSMILWWVSFHADEMLQTWLGDFHHKLWDDCMKAFSKAIDQCWGLLGFDLQVQGKHCTLLPSWSSWSAAGMLTQHTNSSACQVLTFLLWTQSHPVTTDYQESRKDARRAWPALQIWIWWWPGWMWSWQPSQCSHAASSEHMPQIQCAVLSPYLQQHNTLFKWRKT